MSALGQKRTFAVQNGMSALPPIATAKADIFAGREKPGKPYKFSVHDGAHRLRAARQAGRTSIDAFVLED